MGLYDDLNSLDDLRGLIDKRVHESDTVEYKAASRRLESKGFEEAAKDISAFANAQGGVLVYGMVTDPVDKTRPVKLEAIDAWNVEYIRRNAVDAIRHPIPGLRSKTLPTGATAEALLFDIPASPIAPHQVTAHHKYYRRQGADSLPMTHDLVELYFGRRLHPKLEPHFQVREFVEHDDGSVSFLALVGLLNSGGQVAREVFTRLAPNPNRVTIADHSDRLNDQRPVEAGPTTIARQHHGQLYYPGLPQVFAAFRVATRRETLGPQRSLLVLDVYATDMRPRHFNIYASWVTRGEYTLESAESPDMPPIAPLANW
jgi:hypothetical protein